MRSTDEVYGSLAYNGAPLLRVPLCVSRVFLVYPRLPSKPCWNTEHRQTSANE